MRTRNIPLLIFTYIILIHYASSQCIREIKEDVCPQREGFDPDCEERCLRDHPMRIGSGCRLRNGGTLLSFFGIRSFVCQCEMPFHFCERGNGVNPVRRTFSLQTIQEHSQTTRIKENVNCSNSTSSSLQCSDSFDAQNCSWQRSIGADWFTGTPKTKRLPFAVGEEPVNGYLVGVGRQGVSAISLETCSGLCSIGEVRVSMRIWRAPWVQTELCFRERDALLCAPVHITNGKVVNEVIPQTSHFSVSVRFSNVTDNDVIMVDDINLSFDRCSEDQMANRIEEEHRENAEEEVTTTSPAPHQAAGPILAIAEEEELQPVHQASSSAVGSAFIPLSPPSAQQKRRICANGDCTRLNLGSQSSSPIDRTCIGRTANAKCQAKCRNEDDDGSNARCIRQREYPFAKRCVCQLRRSPTMNRFATTEEPTMSLVDGNAERTVVESNSVLDEIAGMGSLLVQKTSELCADGAEKCEDYCRRQDSNSSGICSSDHRIACRCVSCIESLCDFEKNRQCGWTDLRTISEQFNNVSIASKREHDNRYGLSRMVPRSYSGLIRKGWVDGPVLLSVDVFPSHQLQVRICVDSLSRCQDQNVTPRAWNRVTARIKVTRTDKLFLLFYNSERFEKTIALDNISLQSGPCYKQNGRTIL